MHRPRIIPIVIALSAVVCIAIAGDEKVSAEVDVLRESYLRAAERAVSAAMKSTDEKYLTGLEALYKRYTKEAKPEAAIQVRNEITFFKIGGVWKWGMQEGKTKGYITIYRDQTAMETLNACRGTWVSTDKGIKIKWSNGHVHEILLPTNDRKTTGKDSPSSDAIFLNRE